MLAAEESTAKEKVDKTQKEYDQASEKEEMEEDSAGEPEQTTGDPKDEELAAEDPVAEEPTSEELTAEAVNTAAKLVPGPKEQSEAIAAARKADALRKTGVPRVQVR